METQIEETIKAMTLEEKLQLLQGADMGFTSGLERLGIPKVLMTDGPHGVRVVKGAAEHPERPYTMQGEMEPATALPCEALMASTFDRSLVEEAGRLIGQECSRCGVDVLLGPGADGKRSPLGGRNFEYYSEDPCLSGEMAASFIRGIQSEGVGACMKHFVLNEQETRRMSVDVRADERALREIYAKPFETAIRECSPWMIMASYNRANGVYMCENGKLLNGLLKEKLGYDGAVVSDWNAVKDTKASIKGGLDLQMPGPADMSGVRKAVEAGEIPESVIDDHVRRVLRLSLRVLEGRKIRTPFSFEDHHRAAVRIAEEGMVLLKNEGKILPLSGREKIAVIGEPAEKPVFAGGGSASLTPWKPGIPLDEIRRKTAENGGTASYSAGYQGDQGSTELTEKALEAAADADCVIFFAGYQSSEGMDRKDMKLPAAQKDLLRKVSAVNRRVVLVTMTGSVCEYREVEPDVKAILHAWISGEGCGEAIADLLFGKVSPSGKLSETVPLCLENTPAYENFPGFRDRVEYREGIFTGYRWYDTRKIPVLYPFGFGLSYTSFSFGNFRFYVNGEAREGELRMSDQDVLTIRADVTNTGEKEGAEVVQLYVSDRKSYRVRPEKELAGFAKVHLLPGETKTAEITVGRHAFEYYQENLGEFATESGWFDLMLGTSSEDIFLNVGIYCSSGTEVREPLTQWDLFSDFLEDERYQDAAGETLKSLHLGPESPFYQLIIGGTLVQMKGLLGFAGISADQGDRIVEKLVNGGRGNE